MPKPTNNISNDGKSTASPSLTKTTEVANSKRKSSINNKKEQNSKVQDKEVSATVETSLTITTNSKESKHDKEETRNVAKKRSVSEMNGAHVTNNTTTTRKGANVTSNSTNSTKSMPAVTGARTGAKIVVAPVTGAGDETIATTPNEKKRYRCMVCLGCRNADCGVCNHCLGKKKFGGSGKCHLPCIQRYCHFIYPIVNSRSGSRSRDRSQQRLQAQQQQQQLNTVSTSKSNNKVETISIVATNITPPNHSMKGIHQHHQSPVTSHLTTKNKKKPSIQQQHTENNTTATLKTATLNDSITGIPSSEPPTATTTVSSKQSAYTSLSNYISESVDSQLSKHNVHCKSSSISSRLLKRTVGSNDENNSNGTLYGLSIPPTPPENVCAACCGLRDDELNSNNNNCNDDDEDDDGHPVLLCDGVQCGREYHLACCIPPLEAIPETDDLWFCYDCCKYGTTRLLQQYLEYNDKQKADYYSSTSKGTKVDGSYVDFMIRQEMSKITTKRKEKYTIPESELDIGSMITTLAKCDSTKLARTRGGNEQQRQPLDPNEYIGKPIVLYDRSHKMYHTGRIVAFRDEVKTWDDDHSTSDTLTSTCISKDPSHSPSSSSMSHGTFEYFIRFPAGKENRKQSYYHWIVLEEHVLSIGTTLVWARITSSQWRPSILWLRTSMNLLVSSAITHSTQQHNTDVDFVASKTKHKVCALVRSYGDEIYSIINVRDQCVDLFDTDGTDQYLNSHPDNVLYFSIARTELSEQARVRDWYKLQQINPVGHAILSSRDYWSLPQLNLQFNNETQENSTGTVTHEKLFALIPNVRRGLDRSKILQMLHRRGYKTTKDVAASISCTTVAADMRTIDQLCRNADPSS